MPTKNISGTCNSGKIDNAQKRSQANKVGSGDLVPGGRERLGRSLSADGLGLKLGGERLELVQVPLREAETKQSAAKGNKCNRRRRRRRAREKSGAEGNGERSRAGAHLKGREVRGGCRLLEELGG